MDKAKDFGAVASREVVDRTVEALKKNGISATRVANNAEALKKALELIPAGAEVFTQASVTLEAIGLNKEINESGRYTSVRTQLMSLDRVKQAREQRKLGAAPDVAVGSAHAVTEGGSVLVASLTGSQLGTYSYGGGKVVFIVGAQKIVKDVDEGMKRIHEFVLPLESERARKAYGLPAEFQSYPSKILLFNREIVPDRVHLILVEQCVGF